MQRVAPPVSRPLQRSLFGKPMSRSMPAWNRVPGAVLDGYTRLRADGLEANFDLGGVLGGEIRLAPGEHQPFARLPDGNASDLKRRAVFERRSQAASLAGLEGEPAIAGVTYAEEAARLPPRGDLLRKHFERPHRIGRNAQSEKDLRC